MEAYVIFDIDGTLNRTDLYAVEAYRKAMLKRGRTIRREEVISCIGLSPAAIIERLFGSLDEEGLKSWRHDIKEYEGTLMRECACTFDGISETLDALKSAGYGLAICSNAFPGHIGRVLSALNLTGYFDIIGSLDMGEDKGKIIGKMMEDTGCQKACMVGDRMFDIRAARANHIPFIGCAYGYAPEEIREADIVVHHPGEIARAVDALLR